MNSLTTTKKNVADKRVRTVSDCGAKALTLLRDRLPIPDSLRLEIESHIQHLPSVAASAETARPLDALATDLWNAAISLLHEHDQHQHVESQSFHLGVLVRVFAFLLLDIATISIVKRTGDQAAKVRIAKVALKASRLCLNADALDYAFRILERCADYVTPTTAEAESSVQQLEGDAGSVNRALQAEYCLLRIMCAWKSDRLDTAHHFYIEFCSIQVELDRALLEQAADLFLCIAGTLSHTAETQTPVLWLDRGLAVLDGCDDDDFADSSTELRLNITSSLVNLLLSTSDETNVERASKLVDDLESVFFLHHRVSVQCLRFQVLTSRSPIDVDQTGQVLKRVTMMTLLTETNFQMILRMISKASKSSLQLALDATTILICKRLLPEVAQDQLEDLPVKIWLEKATVVIVHLLSSQHASSTSLAAGHLQHLLDSIAQRAGDVFSSTAINACQALIWKLLKNTEGEDALRWCAILQHALFERTSLENKARIGRKFILAALANGDSTTARQVFDRMNPSAQNEPITRYLAFKIALQCQDSALARDSLNVISSNAGNDPTYLYACVLDAQKSTAKQIARIALQELIERRPQGIILHSLLRGAVHLLITELDDRSNEPNEIVTGITNIVEIAVAELPDKLPEDQRSKEIEWWTKNTYNLAIRTFSLVPPQAIVKLLKSCIRFFDLHSSTEEDRPDKVRVRRNLCEFLIATTMIAIARSSISESQETLQVYHDARHHIATYLASRPNSQDPIEHQRTLEILKYDLECILKLEQWSSIDAALRACLDLEHVEARWGTLADLLVILHEHMNRLPSSESSSPSPSSSGPQLITEVLQKIINDTWRHDKNMTKLTRWLRLTFSICLADDKSNFSFKLLQQAGAMAANGSHGKHEGYPERELQWLASSGFNRAVDLVSSSSSEGEEVGRAEAWMDAALELARWAQDNGSLHRVLTGKRELVRERVAARKGEGMLKEGLRE